MIGLFVKALTKAGYEIKGDSAKEVVECFKDYVAEGMWTNLHLEDGEVYTDNGEIVDSVVEMAKALLGL